MSKISKNEILKLLQQYNINEASKNDCLDGTIEVNIKFGDQKMNKQPTIRELILNVTNEVKEMKSDMQVMKSDIKQLKTEMLAVKEEIKQINYRLDRIENCPTIKKELTV